jgi:hypothetical protein
MKFSKLLTLSALSVLVVAPAMAVPVNYGTGIHHWVKSCGLGNGAGTSEYVGMYSCPAVRDPAVQLPLHSDDLRFPGRQPPTRTSVW